MDFALLFALGAAAFAFSTIAGGGGALLLGATAHHITGVERIVQVVHLTNFIGRPTRMLLFWKHVRWETVVWFVPAAWIGSWLGVRLFVEIEAEWLRLVLGGFLLTTPFQFRFGKSRRSFHMPLWGFAPLGLVVAATSSLVGATGAVLNVFYFNYGLTKEHLVGTKAVNSFLVSIVQLSAYLYYGAWDEHIWGYGLALGCGAILGNVLGKRWLKRFSNVGFQRLALAVMVVSGVLLIVGYFR